MNKLATRPQTPNAGAAAVIDDVPEFYHYEDTGCEMSRSCLNCPLSRCKYDDPEWYQRNRRLAKDFRVWAAMQQEQLTPEEAAQRFSVTVRTIWRIIQRCRKATLDIEHEDLLVFAAA